jgi:hypothetical protein
VMNGDLEPFIQSYLRQQNQLVWVNKFCIGLLKDRLHFVRSILGITSLVTLLVIWLKDSDDHESDPSEAFIFSEQ